MQDAEVRRRLAPFRIGIAGCGGLGSNCAVALARAGIGHLILVDFDVVDLSNLNRQYYFRDQIGLPKTEALTENIRRIDPTVQIWGHNLTITSENIPKLFSGCDVVVEAFDRADQKLMLIETMVDLFPHIPLVSGSGMAGYGRTDLLRCERHGTLYVCGDQQTEVSEELSPLAPRVGIVSNMQANAVLEILLGEQDSLKNF